MKFPFSSTLKFFTAALFTVLFFSSGKIEQEDPCAIVEVVRNPVDPLCWSRDSTKFLVNKKDSNGVSQIYIGTKTDHTLKCISLNGPFSALKPWAKRNKMQVVWHPSGEWIICAVEKEKFNEEWLKGTKSGRKLLEGWLQCGLWMDIWAVKPDGSKWSLLATTVRGMTGPAFTPDGKKGVWAEALDSANLSKDKFGKWRLMLSEFGADSLGNVHFISTKNINPKGANWVEPGNFSPDGKSVLLSADIGLADARGQDQYILNIETGEVKNLTNSPKVWDEHGFFSPDGKKVLFMSSWPYRAEKNSYKVVGIKTEFMLMNTDGSGLQQLTHFRTKGYPESTEGIAATAFFSSDGKTIYAQTLIFPAYENFIIRLKGPCGNQDKK
jgi:Tol biopolymer transport system component